VGGVQIMPVSLCGDGPPIGHKGGDWSGGGKAEGRSLPSYHSSSLHSLQCALALAASPLCGVAEHMLSALRLQP